MHLQDSFPYVETALIFVPAKYRPEASRLLEIVLESGADSLTALTSVYRWTRGRKRYAEIYEGLDRFFNLLIEVTL